MGFFFRKSESFGPFRFTLSKSGLSSSVKIGNTRFTRRADGHTTKTTKLGKGTYLTRRN
ncbi:DUF4236 domain-containing protein [Tsukamurella soli]|uniref:DUF4236 domain-containing protein n=1 Tax=Tsukamurella soli TaxID=644556 RepID=A0ABP8J9B9_9ACTN